MVQGGNEMITLFNEYKDSGKISEALMVGRNMVNQEPNNVAKTLSTSPLHHR